MVAFGFREMVQEESHGQHLKVVAWDCLSCAAQRRSTPPPHAELLPAGPEAAAAALPHRRAPPHGHRRSPHERPPLRAPAPSPHDEQRAQGGNRPPPPEHQQRHGDHVGDVISAGDEVGDEGGIEERPVESTREERQLGGAPPADADLPEQEAVELSACPHCGRRFAANRHAKHVAICGHASARAQARRVRSVAGVGNGERAGGASDGAGSLSARS